MACEGGIEENFVADEEPTGGTFPEFSEGMLRDLLDLPYGWNFFAAVRLLQQARGSLPPIGSARLVEEDFLRFRQIPRLAFSPSGLVGIKPRDGAKTSAFELTQSFFGFFGPRGPLPLHITEDALSDPEKSQLLVDFCNMLQHRMTALLYKSWAAANPAASRDIADEDPFKRYVDAMYGAAPSGFANRTALDDDTRRYLAGPLANGNGSVTALSATCETIIGSAVSIETETGEWLKISPRDRTCLGHNTGVPAVLGESIVLGEHSFSLQTCVTIRTAPLTLKVYRALLSGGAICNAVWASVRHVVGLSVSVRLQPVLHEHHIPIFALGGPVQLGYDTWFHQQNRVRARSDMILIDTDG